MLPLQLFVTAYPLKVDSREGSPCGLAPPTPTPTPVLFLPTQGCPQWNCENEFEDDNLPYILAKLHVLL